MPLVEYLYVDEERLDTYFEQISAPVTYDKVPEWNAEIGLTGPKGGGKQARFARPYTTHEKVSMLTKYLEEEGLVGYERAYGYVDAEEAFRLETFQAKRVFIPTKQRDSSPGGLSLWISLKDPSSGVTGRELGHPRYHPGTLYLLEDYRDADTPKPSGPIPSMYSMLGWLLYGGLSTLTRGASRYDDLPELDLSGASDNRELERFSVDPTVALSQLGAQVGPARKIRSLYRIRATFLGRPAVTTFGYPIFITEGTDTV
jgi:hypothetical protein